LRPLSKELENAMFTTRKALLATMILLPLLLGACSGYSIELQKFTTLTGKVTREDGSDFANAGVIVRTQADGLAPYVWETVTESDGSYSLEVKWFQYADYYLLVVHPERTGQPNAGADYDLKLDAWPYSDEDKDVTTITVTTTPVGDNSISGTVLADTDADGTGDTPLSGVTVSTAGGQSAVSGDGGLFHLGELPAGTYTLTPVLDGYEFTPASAEITVPPDATCSFVATALGTEEESAE
jgi:hypothetical protein